MKLEKGEIQEKKTPKIPTLPSTIVSLETPRLELGTPIGTEERCNRLCTVIK